jgi:hypothetical protein
MNSLYAFILANESSKFIVKNLKRRSQMVNRSLKMSSFFADKFNKITPLPPQRNPSKESWRSQRVAPLNLKEDFPPLNDNVTIPVQLKALSTSTISIAERLKQSIAKEEETAKLRRLEQNATRSVDLPLVMDTSSLLIKRAYVHKRIEEAKQFIQEVEEENTRWQTDPSSSKHYEQE